MTDLTLTAIEKLIIQEIGEEAASEGLFLTDRKVWVSDVSIISMTCPYCSKTFVGPDYNVYHLLATHAYGHQQEEAMLSAAALDDDDDEGGLSA